MTYRNPPLLRPPHVRRMRSAAVLAAFTLLAAVLMPASAQEFVGSEACAACHSEPYARWRESHHHDAMQVASSESVLGNFDDATFEYFGTTTRFFTRNGTYFVRTDNAEGELQDFEIAYTFGVYPLQQYLIEFPDGRLQALGIAWDSRPAAEGGQRWYHLYPDEEVDHADPLHWTGAFQNWNSRCASCHSTDLAKNYSRERNTYDTQWAEINVGCEACHGAGSAHVAWANGDESVEGRGLAVDVGAVWRPTAEGLPIPDEVDFTLGPQIQVCAACHSLRTELAHRDVAADYFSGYNLSPLAEGLYHADGQIREEVYVTGSFLQSKMHANLVSCTNCHDPHGGRVRIPGNGLCLQCHEARTFQSEEHFFHPPDSPGAQCVNCHMPEQTYMGVDARRDHSFRIPDPIASVELGVPNACTQCHTDRDDAWAAAFVRERTGRTEPVYAHARLFAAARAGDDSVAAQLAAYARNAAQPAILRATALVESARFPSQAHLRAVVDALDARDPLLRGSAAGAIGFLDPTQRLQYLSGLIADPAKSVRMAVARQLADLPVDAAPAAIRPRLAALLDEYEQSLLYNADMPEAMSELGLLYARRGDLEAARDALLHARELSPRFLGAMVNLADVYRALRRDDLGERVLDEALEEYPESGDAHHALGLLYVRTGRTPASVALFARASELAPENAQYALVHGLALIQVGDVAEGVEVLEAAARRFPADTRIRDALAAYRPR